MKRFDQVGAVTLMLMSIYIFGAAFGLWPGPQKPPSLGVVGLAFFGWGHNLWLLTTREYRRPF